MPTLSNELRQQIDKAITCDVGCGHDTGFEACYEHQIDRLVKLFATQNTALLKEVTDYFYWRIDCNTLISELEGWRGCIDNAKDQTERHFNSKLAAMGDNRE